MYAPVIWCMTSTVVSCLAMLSTAILRVMDVGWIGLRVSMESRDMDGRKLTRGLGELQVSVVNEATVAAIDCGLTGGWVR